MLGGTPMFLYGAMVFASILVGVFFLRFWRETRDSLFLTFALGFWVLAVNWLLLAFTGADEIRNWAFLLRLLAYAFFLTAILRKNVRRG